MFENMLLKNKLDMMTESASLENYNSSAIGGLDESDLSATLALVESFDDDIQYCAQAIPIILKESGNDNLYIVEYDMLYKLMESYDIDETEAMQMLAEENNIPMSNFYLLIESDEYFFNEMKEAGSKGGSQLKGKVIQNATKSIEDLKAKGIKIVKKSGKKKHKKSKGKRK